MGETNIKLTVGDTIYFSGGHKRFEAAKFAMSVDEKNNPLSQVVKAFLFKKVTIPKKATKKQIHDYKVAFDKACKKKLVDRVVSEAGFDKEGKRGVAADYSRQSVIRTWPFKGILHPGHAAVSVKKNLNNENEHTYISWWPTSEALSGENKLFSEESRKGELLTRRIGRSNPDYKTDKYDELSNSARKKLREAHEARQKIRSGKLEGISDDLLKTAGTVFPRERQKELSYTVLTQDEKGNDYVDHSPWGVSADKVYVPLMGPNSRKKGQEKIFCMFGLHEGKMNLYWSNVQSAEDEVDDKYAAKYRMFNKNESCVGMAAGALRIGGADLYTDSLKKPKIYRTPNWLHKSAIKLQEKIDFLNDKSEEVVYKGNEFIKELPITRKSKIKEMSLEKLVNKIRGEIGRKELEDSEKDISNKVGGDVLREKIEKSEERTIYELYLGVLRLLKAGKLNSPNLTRLAIKLVECLETERSKPLDEKLNRLFYLTYPKIVELMKDIHHNEELKYKQLNENLK